MNKALIAERFSKAIGTYAQKADIQQQIAEKMTCLLQQHLPATPFNKVVEFGCGTGNYSRLLYHTLQPKQFFLNDLCNGMQACCHDLLDQGAIFLTGDAETLDFPEDTELLTSCSTLQWFESPENFFHRCHHRLSRNGYLAITTFGQENMKEIRSVTGQGLPYRSLSELEAALTPHYNLIHSEEEKLHRSFPSPLQVLYHLKETGVTGTGKQHWTRRELNRFCEEYIRLFGDNQSVPLTYHPIYIIAKKRSLSPDPSPKGGEEERPTETMKQNVFFVSGIDTDAGKSYATGFLARELNQKGNRTITQKFIQTGNVGHSEDIDLHRRIMGIPPTEEDRAGLTMPEIFSYPASPHLASRLDGRAIDFNKMEQATAELSRRYDTVLLEGAGGLMVPLTEDLLTIDYIAQKKYPLIFVTSGKLGSINHTLLSFEAIHHRGIRLDTVMYNLYPTVADKTIQEDTLIFIRKQMGKYFPDAQFILVPEI